MTFLEKAMELDEKRGYKSNKSDVINTCCPSDYCLEGIRECDVSIPDSACEKCWNREMTDAENEKIMFLITHFQKNTTKA